MEYSNNLFLTADQTTFIPFLCFLWLVFLFTCLPHKANVRCDDGLHAARRLALVHSPHPRPTHQELRSRGTDRGETQQWPFQCKQGPLFSSHPPHPCSSTPTNASPLSLLSQGPSALFLLAHHENKASAQVHWGNFRVWLRGTVLQ